MSETLEYTLYLYRLPPIQETDPLWHWQHDVMAPTGTFEVRGEEIYFRALGMEGKARVEHAGTKQVGTIWVDSQFQVPGPVVVNEVQYLLQLKNRDFMQQAYSFSHREEMALYPLGYKDLYPLALTLLNANYRHSKRAGSGPLPVVVKQTHHLLRYPRGFAKGPAQLTIQIVDRDRFFELFAHALGKPL